MAVTLDPRLEQMAQREVVTEPEPVAVVEEIPATPAEALPDATLETPTEAVEQNAETVSAPEPAPDTRLFIDTSRGYYQELSRLEQENADIRNAIKTKTGRYAAREYKPKMAELEAQLNELRAENSRLKTQGMEVEELKTRLLEDPEFRRQYDAGNAAQNGPDPRLAAWFESSFNDAVEEAERDLPPQVIGRYVQALQGQWYDYARDAQGNPGRALTPQEAMTAFQRDLNSARIQYIKQAQQALATPPPAAPVAQAAPATPPVAPVPDPVPAQVSKPNQALSASSPDLTPNNVNRTAGSMSIADYKGLNPTERIKLFPEGLEAAIGSGKVYSE